MNYDEYVITDDNIIIFYLKGHQQNAMTVSALAREAGYKYVGTV